MYKLYEVELSTGDIACIGERDNLAQARQWLNAMNKTKAVRDGLRYYSFELATQRIAETR